MRKTMTILFLLGGIGMAVASFVAAIPTEPLSSSPRVPFASVFFIVGVGIAFLSAVVYELTPGEHSPRKNHSGKARLVRR